MINPDKEQEKIIKKVFAAVDPLLKPGTPIGDLDKTARKVMDKQQRYFIHSLGHGIGISVHEKPTIYKSNKEELKEGMVPEFTFQTSLA